MRFTKMQGAGNDFIVLNNMDRRFSQEQLAALARRLCQRRVSIGADGLMSVEPSETQGADFGMGFFNSDGSLAEMCGNGARCIARFAFENGIAKEHMTFATEAGAVEAWREDQRMYRIRINDPGMIRMGLELNGLPCDYVELGRPGVPHAAVPVTDLARRWKEDRDGLKALGSSLRFHSEFPKGANVNFYEILGESRVLIRTFERGVEDFTLACGTGVCSVAVALAVSGRFEGKQLAAEVPGGMLFVELKRAEVQKAGLGGRIQGVYLIGPTNIVMEGDVMDEDLAVDLRLD